MFATTTKNWPIFTDSSTPKLFEYRKKFGIITLDSLYILFPLACIEERGRKFASSPNSRKHSSGLLGNIICLSSYKDKKETLIK